MSKRKKKAAVPDLPILNAEAFENVTREEFRDCLHIIESRNKPNEDLYGYVLKVHFETRNQTMFVKSCKECAHQEYLRDFIVAACPYELLSDATMRRRIATETKNTIEPLTELGKKILEEVYGTKNVN